MPSQEVKDLRVRLSQVPPGPDKDAELQGAINGALGILDAYMRTKIGGKWTGFVDPWPVASGRVVWGWGGTSLWLPPHLVGSVTAVSVGGTPLALSSFTEDPSTGALIRLSTPYLDSSGYSTWNRVAYSVTAQWGFGPMDAGTREILYQLATNLWRGRDRGMWTDSVNALGTGTLTFTGGLTAEQRMVLDAVVAPWIRHAGTAEVTVEAPRLRTPVQGNW